MHEDALLQELRTVDSCALCDASSKRARVVRSVRPLQRGYHLAGRAHTVRVDGDLLEVLYAIRNASPGDVLAIDTGMRGEAVDAEWPRAGAVVGELLAHEAQRRGVLGFVIDGNCRDSPMLLSMGLPIFARGTHPKAATVHKRGATQCNVSLGGVDVHPGEFVLGDDDGVVVCSHAELREWLPKAKSIQELDTQILQHVQRGGSLFDRIPNFDRHLEAIQSGQESELQLV